MKELQNFVYRHMDALKHHKRYLAMLTALSMLVTFIVPLILMEPADSMTGILVCNKTVHTHNAECYVGDTLICDIEEHIHTNECYKKVSTVSLKGTGNEATYTENNIPVYNYYGATANDGWSPEKVGLYTLLFGETKNPDDHWVDLEGSLDDNLLIANQNYFLGYASDFCAFIEGDFIAYDADAEGRIFVGGDLIFKGHPDVGYWNYQVGAGDYGHSIPIWETDEYSGVTGFASGIIGGKVYRLGTISTLASISQTLYPRPVPSTQNNVPRHSKGYDIFVYPEEGAYKKFIVGNLGDSLHLDEDNLDGQKDIPYEDVCNHLYYDSDCTVCNEGNTVPHEYLENVNELAQFYDYDKVSVIQEKMFDTLRARSMSLASIDAIEAKIEDNDTLVIDASNIGDAKTVYFNISDWKQKDENGDDLVIKNVQIIVPPDRVEYAESGKKGSEFALNQKTIGNLDLNIIISCDDSIIEIPQTINTYIKVGKNGETPDAGKGYRISNAGLEDVAQSNTTNNHPVSSNILYNFYNATLVEFKGEQGGAGANFNGTIMAPNAHVKTKEKCPGHLSGALVAKSFEGGLEFGYRPYRGGVDIFGMASGYAIPVDKVDESGKTLPGALFAVKQDGKFVSLFESGNGTNFAVLPSRVDFTGNTPYKPEEVGKGSSERPYVGQEIAGEKLTAPVDFTLYTDRNCNNGIVDNSNILPKFYLDANQALNIDANENFKCVEVDTENHIYEIQLIKPVTSLTITGRNTGESTEVKTVTVNFKPVTLGVNKTEYTLKSNDVGIDLTVGDRPTNYTDTIYYKYFLNGNEISNGYTTDSSYNNYHPTALGGATFSVSAYVKIGEEYCEIANATAEKKVNVKPFNYDDIKLVVPDSITSGKKLEIKVDNPPADAEIKYIFNGKAQDNGYFETNEFVGKDLPVEVIITTTTTDGNKEEFSLQDTVTVNFGTDIKFNDYNTTYDVNPYSNLDFYLEEIGKYLNQVPNDKKTITFYFKDEPIQSENFNYAKIDQKLVGENMTVYAVITANGLEHTVYGNSVTGKYNDNLSLYVESGAFIVGNNIHMNVSNAPVEAEVIFEAVDSKGVTQWTDTQTAYNGTCSAVFQTEVAGDYTIKASIKYENNTPKVLVHPNTITVSPKPVNGNLSVNPSEVYAGNAVELKIHGATIGAEVVFTIIEPNGNQSYPKGQIDQSGEYRTSFTPTLSGEHTIKAVISKDGASISLETSLTVKENTSTLNGNLSISSGGVNNPQTVNPGDQVTVNVTNATNGAVLNLTITGPDGKKVEPDSVTISNGTYTYDFNPQDVGTYDVGTYTVTGKLTSGTQERELEKVVFTIMGNIEIVAKKGEDVVDEFVKGEPVTLSLKEKPNVTARVEYYLDSLDSSNPMHTKDEFKNVSGFNYDNESITFTPGQTGKHKYRANAIDANGNVIATVTQEFETVDPTYDVTIEFYTDGSIKTENVYNAGETVTLRIYGLSGQINNVQGNIPGVAGLSIQKGNETKEYTEYTFTAPNNTCTDGDLVITINLNQGSPIQLLSKITILDPASVTSLSLRKYLSILAEENLSDNEIEIDVPQGYERISNLKIAFLGDIYEKQSTFKLQAEFTHSDGTTTTQYYDNTNVSGQNPYYLDIPSEHLANNVTKIVITPLEGSITVDKIYPTYIKKENTVVKTSATGFTLIEEDVKVIPVEDWVLALDSITFNLESKKNTNIWYALIEEGKENEAPAFSEVRVQNADSISISNLNAENIAQIMVYTEDESLTVKDYTISGFVGDKKYTEDELNELKNNEQHIINYYTLVEQQAPVGYFKEDAIYTIEVDEIIKLNNLVGSCPKEVKTKITVKDKDGNVVLSYTVETIDNENTRTINIIKTSEEVEYVDATFTVTKNDDNEILVVECTNSGVDTSDWSLTKPGGYGAYYFDPEAMMVVPVPTPIKYTNKMGLLFRKIDDNGAAVNGVEIKLYKDGDEVKDNELWYWDENSREHLINFKKLPIKTADNPNPVYKIKETYAGGKYEIADEIYFMRTGEKEVKYWLGSETMPTERTDENQLTVLNFTQNVESRVIRMENIRVVGVKLKLRKTDLETGSKIEGDAENNDYAVFALYANDETELLNPINVENGEVDIAFDPNTVYDTKYVENGYLKPGAYYLREIKAPNGYETSTNDFYFNVIETSDGAYKAEKAEIMSGVTEVKETQSDGKVHTLTTFKKAALKLISEGIAAETINASTPIIQFKFKTSSGETGWGNAKFKAKVNGTEVSPNTAKYPSGCDVHENGMSFQSTEVTVEFTVQQLCDLFDVPYGEFNTINEFVIDTCNSTTVEDLVFYGVADDTGDDTENNAGNDTENNTENTTPATPALKIERETVIIPNSPLGDTMNLRVDKKWVGDSDVTELRKPVNVALKRKAGVNGSYATFKPENQKEEYITLNSLNDWTYTWKDLPRYENGPTDEGDDVLYYYKVEEITTVTGYTSEVPDVNINEGGIVTITNTLVPVSIDVEKIWNSDGKGNVSAFLPQTLTVKLQAKVSDAPETWQDIPGKTLTLTAANKQEGDTEETQTWKGTFENLPKGYVYRIVENVSAVWEVKYTTQDVSTNTETIIESFKLENKYNVETGSIAVQKLWQNLTGETTLPYSITVELYRSVIAPSYTETDAPYTEDYKTDYARLLQHSLYFYDANMCGTDVAANSALAWRTNCHTEDEVVGGYHDAGDHAVFGLPQGYTASMLGWTYYEFIKNNTTDVGVKIDSNDAEHLKVILERFYDFFVDSVRYSDGKISEILVQKGDGNVDHSYWGAPEKQTERKTTGEDTEMFWRDYGADIASEYAAALALGYLNFYDSNGSEEDKAKYENYLKVAKDLYEFAERNPKVFNEWGVNLDETLEGKSNPGFYNSESYADDMALAAGWLHLADPDGGYKAKFDNIKKNDSFWGFSWNDVTVAAYAVGAHIGSNDWSTVASAINGKIDENDPTKYFKQDNWGSARYNAIMQTAALVVAKNDASYEDTYKAWAAGQMNLLLGGNSWKNTLNGVCDGGTVSGTTSPICLVTNFVPDGVNVDTPQAPHHRAASGWDSLDEYKVNCGYDDDSYALIGAMVGGPAFGNHDDGKQQQMYDYNHDHPLANHTYIDCLHDYCCNEVSIDYNAGLVGAAVGLYYFYGTGERSEKIEGVEFGSYGLAPIEDLDNYNSNKGLESPIISAPSQVTQNYNLNPVNDVVLKGFAMKQTAISINEDSLNENCYHLSEHTLEKKSSEPYDSYTYNCNYDNITRIEVEIEYGGEFGIQFIAYSGSTKVKESGWMQTNNNDYPNPYTYFSNITFDNPTTITSLEFFNTQLWQWDDNDLVIKDIRLYYESGTTFAITPEKTDVAFNEKIKLTPSGHGTIANVSSWTVAPAGAATITKENDNWYLTAGNTAQDNVTVTATDADGKTGTVKINIKGMEITGADRVGIQSNITLDKQNAPVNATRFEWISSDTSKATVENGKVTGVSAGGPVTITLKAYDDSNTLLATDTKDINVVNIRMETYTDLGQVSNSGSKYFFSLSQLPSGAILKSVSINVSPANGSSTEYEGGLMIGKENSSPEPWNQKNISGTLSPEGQTFTLEESYMTNIDCSKHDFCFGLWNKACTVNINWITFEYEMDSTYIEIKYKNEDVDAKTIRKGQSVNVTVTATGGEIGSVQLKNGETVQDLGIGGSYEITPDNAGNYTIVAAMAGDNSDKTDLIALTVKDNITINGSEVMDLNGRQTLTVNNAIGGITWAPVGEGNVDYTVSGDLVTFTNGATLNTCTGEVKSSSNGGEITITATDSYDGKSSEITIYISEKPKVPELPKKVFLESVTRIPLTEGADKEWKLDIQNLPMTDAKGNPYYYYIQEVGYTQVQGGTEKPLTDSVGHYIYSSDAIYMPVSYYNNGITPVKEGTLNVAKVENKFQSKQEATLPSTGGSGVTTYYYLGGVIMLLSIAGFTGLKRREKKRRKE